MDKELPKGQVAMVIKLDRHQHCRRPWGHESTPVSQLDDTGRPYIREVAPGLRQGPRQLVAVQAQYLQLQ